MTEILLKCQFQPQHPLRVQKGALIANIKWLKVSEGEQISSNRFLPHVSLFFKEVPIPYNEFSSYKQTDTFSKSLGNKNDTKHALQRASITNKSEKAGAY